MASYSLQFFVYLIYGTMLIPKTHRNPLSGLTIYGLVSRYKCIYFLIDTTHVNSIIQFEVKFRRFTYAPAVDVVI